MKKELTDEEWELVQALRNFRKMYPKTIEFELYITILIDKLMSNEN